VLHSTTGGGASPHACFDASRAQVKPVKEPITTLNALFSAPGTTATSWDDTRRTLETAELFWIATVRSDGRPHMTPLVAVWHDDVLHFCTGENELKAANLRDNQNVVLTTGCNRWDGGMDVVVEGRAVRVTDQGALERLAAAWTHKWDGRWNYEPGPEGFKGEEHDTVLVFTVRPDTVFAFAKGAFSHTKHAF
jgi:nitroimidazol reductase NimA-like FMN-containing flavoprotein (pyridoxamine 5'-phosphate oxidase superfamily)